ncbi:DMT family transporter [Candidatus Entotheonella palauensis]|uniref:EamA domain-containing protein n=1 Tax=Candidatus Entotheonella gemina TaxID=1429439 RepID=W4MEY5_9BACT|nr:DMT family transporter [Candidatus Entotheonella palauensis]ETX08735.1 MAG: hypothetical protein ETSY2_03620 [Candidatus Entotheonella gemina]
MTVSIPALSSAIHNHRRAVAALLLAAALWSSSGLFIKIIPWSAVAISGARSAIAALLFACWLRPSTLRFSRLQWATAICFTGAQLSFFIGTKIAPAANVVFLNHTAPLYVIPLGLWLLGERPKRADGLSMLVIFAGMLLFFSDGFSSARLVGNLWGALSGVMMAGMIVGMRMQKAANPVESIFLSHLLGSIVGLPFALQETWTLPTVTGVAFLGVVQIGLSFILYSAAIKHVEALEATILTMLEPILNPLLVFWVLSEVPSGLALLGAVLVIAGVLTRACIGSRWT